MELLVDSYTYDRFVEYCKDKGVPVSIAATEALRKFMEWLYGIST